jgi:cytochrome c oxidase subunit 2
VHGRLKGGAYGGMMKTLKLTLMGLMLAAAPAMLAAQPAPGTMPALAPAPAAALPASPASSAAAGAPVASSATPVTTPVVTPPNSKAAVADISHYAPDPEVGHPLKDGFKIQPQVTEVGQDALWMHNVVLMPIITIISLFVLALLLWVVFRFRAAANPVPSRTAHNTTIEIIWTLAPVLLLLVIAVPSIKLLAKQYSPPKADLTVKVIGNQWYWTYQYPDNGDFEIVSNMLAEDKRKPSDGPRLMAVDERMVVPAGAVVKLIVTSNDVIHSFAVPAFWTKMDAVPGRLNETWFKVPADKPGVYFGQCSELCGARHAFMPIAVEAVPPARFAAWVAAKGGTMPGAAAAKNPDATSAASPATAATGASAAPTAPLAVGAPGAPVSDPTVNATATPPTSRQGANQNSGQ